MTETRSHPELGEIPVFTGRRLLLVVTGALSAAHTPFWTNWLRTAYPSAELRVVLTRSAGQFVTRQALTSISGAVAEVDEWPSEPAAHAFHVELTEWADTFVVAPATLGFCSRLANGMGDSPVLLALQCTTAPVVLAPSLPPGGVTSRAYQRALTALQEMPHVSVVPPVSGVSTTTGRRDAAPNAPMPMAIAAAERLRRGREAAR
ncbi:flavoprotein [Streptomyces sp. NPDC048241]|uniref:flavoprotein n=1 Tax=Streptomyces sp. NPDC048241 TaxID=3365521 RepID=UPI00371084C8